MLNVPDVDLMEMMARRQMDALGELYDRYGRLVFTVAVHVVGDSETAEEITQDVFLRAWEGAASYRADVAKVSSWLVSITRNRAIDELRRRGVRPEKAHVDWPDDPSQDPMEELVEKQNTEETVEQAMQQEGIRRAVTSLPRDQRVVLNLAFFKGLSHSQIADLLGEPLGTVKSRVRLAMLKLRDVLVEIEVVERDSQKRDSFR